MANDLWQRHLLHTVISNSKTQDCTWTVNRGEACLSTCQPPANIETLSLRSCGSKFSAQKLNIYQHTQQPICFVPVYLGPNCYKIFLNNISIWNFLFEAQWVLL